MNENYIGTDFDDFLTEEGLLEEAEVTAVKRILAYKISELMVAQKLSKAKMTHRMKTSQAALDRLLDPENRSVTLNKLEKAARSLGKHLRLTLI